MANIIFTINTNWYYINQIRFEGNNFVFHIVVDRIIVNVSLYGNHTLSTVSNFIEEFQILKYFHVGVHPPKVPTIEKVIWRPPKSIELNRGSIDCGSIFRDNFDVSLVCFAMNLCITIALIRI